MTGGVPARKRSRATQSQARSLDVQAQPPGQPITDNRQQSKALQPTESRIRRAESIVLNCSIGEQRRRILKQIAHAWCLTARSLYRKSDGCDGSVVSRYLATDSLLRRRNKLVQSAAADCLGESRGALCARSSQCDVTVTRWWQEPVTVFRRCVQSVHCVSMRHKSVGFSERSRRASDLRDRKSVLLNPTLLWEALRIQDLPD
jgi:hypothetical protein